MNKETIIRHWLCRLLGDLLLRTWLRWNSFSGAAVLTLTDFLPWTSRLTQAYSLHGKNRNSRELLWIHSSLGTGTLSHLPYFISQSKLHGQKQMPKCRKYNLLLHEKFTTHMSKSLDNKKDKNSGTIIQSPTTQWAWCYHIWNLGPF